MSIQVLLVRLKGRRRFVKGFGWYLKAKAAEGTYNFVLGGDEVNIRSRRG
jgi:hypothetical protein